MKILPWVLISTLLQSGTVRDLHTDGSKAEPIYLCLGQSTVLSFREKPIKMVAGNKNNFNFEFISNDITIQPLRRIESNLFVYCKHDQHVFNLRFSGSQCDDLVRVTSHVSTVDTKTAKFTLANSIKLTVSSPVRAAIGENVWMIRMALFNLGEKAIRVNNITIKLNRSLWQWVWKKDLTKQGESNTGRIIFHNKISTPISIHFEYAGKSHRLIFPMEAIR